MPGTTDAVLAESMAVQSPNRVRRVLDQNRRVPFVDRIVNASKYPSRPNYDEQGNLVSRSTHLMSRAGGGPNEPIFVYPTLQLIDGKWVEDRDPTDALKRGNVIYFDSAEEADRFAEGSWKPFAGKTRDDK